MAQTNLVVECLNVSHSKGEALYCPIKCFCFGEPPKFLFCFVMGQSKWFIEKQS
jgi:hypothetical protein